MWKVCAIGGVAAGLEQICEAEQNFGRGWVLVVMLLKRKSKLQKKFTFVKGFALLLVLVFFPAQQVKADAGPEPPSMTFYFDLPSDYAIEHVEIRRCTTPTCEQFTVFPPENPQPWERMWCDGARCLAVGIGSRSYFQLMVHFSNEKTLVSNVFRDWSYAATYHVHVQNDALIVEEERTCCSLTAGGVWNFLLFWPMLGFTLFVELLATVWYARRIKRKIKDAYVILANVLSFSIVWFVFPALFYATPLVWLVAEPFAFVFEGILFYVKREKMNLSGKQAFVLSAVANAASILAAMAGFGLLALIFD